MKKKILCIILCSAVLLSGCSGNTTTQPTVATSEITAISSETTTTSAPETTTTTTASETTTTAILTETSEGLSTEFFTGTVDGITLTCSGWELIRDDFGKDCLLLSLEFKNDTGKETSYVLNINDTIMQNGIECTGTPFTAKDDSKSQLANVMSGYSLSFKKAFIIDDMTKPIFVKFGRYYQNDVFFCFSYDPATGTATESEDITVSSGASGKTSESDAAYSVSIKSYSIEKDYQGKPFLKVVYTFSHNQDEAISFATRIKDKAYQNGIECDSLVFSDALDSTNSLKKINSGVEIEVEAGYILQDTTSDVLIKISELFDFRNDTPLLEQTITLS